MSRKLHRFQGLLVLLVTMETSLHREQVKAGHQLLSLPHILTWLLAKGVFEG